MNYFNWTKSPSGQFKARPCISVNSSVFCFYKAEFSSNECRTTLKKASILHRKFPTLTNSIDKPRKMVVQKIVLTFVALAVPMIFAYSCIPCLSSVLPDGSLCEGVQTVNVTYDTVNNEWIVYSKQDFYSLENLRNTKLFISQSHADVTTLIVQSHQLLCKLQAPPSLWAAKNS